MPKIPQENKMKTTISLLLFFSSAILIAHTGHGLVESGFAHYLTSALHAVPYLLMGFAVAFVLKKKRQAAKVKVEK